MFSIHVNATISVPIIDITMAYWAPWGTTTSPEVTHTCSRKYHFCMQHVSNIQEKNTTSEYIA